MEDFGLVLSSFQSQYGIRLSRDLEGMKWDEFRDLLTGLSPDTALGRIVAIRAEEDRNVLEHFSREQHRIRNEWRARNAGLVEPGNMEDILEQLRQGFLSMAGG